MTGAGSALPAFARTADVIEEVAEWAGVHLTATLMAMRGVSGVWRGAVSSALRRMAAHEDEGWASASRVSDYVAEKPVVARLCIVAGGGEWLREAPDCVFGATPQAREPPITPAGPSPSVVFEIDVFRRLPLLEHTPVVDVFTSADAEALFGALSAHCPQLKTLALRLQDPETLSNAALALLPPRIECLDLGGMKSAGFAITAALDALLPRLAATLRDVVVRWRGPPTGVFECTERHCGPQLRRCDIRTGAAVRPTHVCCNLEEFAGVTDDDTCRALAANCPKLTKLNAMGSGDLTAAGLQALAAGCKVLTDLRLPTGAQIQVSDLVALAEQCPNLRVFGLPSVTGVSKESLADLAKAAAGLETLSFAYCATALPADVLCGMFAHTPALTNVSFGYRCGVTDGVLAAVAAGCPRLRVLRNGINQSAHITDVGVSALASACPDLRALTLRRGARASLVVSDRGIAALARGCPRLTELNVELPILTDESRRTLAAHARRLFVLSCQRTCFFAPGLIDFDAATVAVGNAERSMQNAESAEGSRYE